MEVFTYERLLKCLNSPNPNFVRLSIVLTNNLLSENIVKVVESQQIDKIIACLLDHLKKSIEVFNQEPENEDLFENLFEIVKVFQIIGLNKDDLHKSLVLNRDILDVIHQLFTQSKSDTVFEKSLKFYENILFVHQGQISNRLVRLSIDPYNLLEKLEKMTREDNNTEKHLLKECKILIKMLKRPIEENIDVEKENITEEE